jgi:hypothetical protein
MKDATFSMAGFFDALADEDLVDSATLDVTTGDYALNAMIQGGVVGGADDILLHFPAGANTVGDICYGAKGAATSYGLEGGSGDLIGASVELTSCVGRERSVLAKTLASSTDTFTGTTLNNTLDTEDGGSAYLMVTDWVSGSLPIWGIGGTTYKQYITGLRDGTFPLEGNYDPTADGYLSTMYDNDVAAAFEYYPHGTTGGSVKYTGTFVLTSFEITTGSGDKGSISAEAQITGAVTRTTV